MSETLPWILAALGLFAALVAGVRLRQVSLSLAATRQNGLQQELASAHKEIERLKAKGQTQESLYVSIRGDLEAKKDRLRRQQEEIERLQALKVAVVDTTSDAIVDATGGEAAEREDESSG